MILWRVVSWWVRDVYVLCVIVQIHIRILKSWLRSGPLSLSFWEGGAVRARFTCFSTVFILLIITNYINYDHITKSIILYDHCITSMQISFKLLNTSFLPVCDFTTPWRSMVVCLTILRLPWCLKLNQIFLHATKLRMWLLPPSQKNIHYFF